MMTRVYLYVFVNIIYLQNLRINWKKKCKKIFRFKEEVVIGNILEKMEKDSNLDEFYES
jgi:hypothetical protein